MYLVQIPNPTRELGEWCHICQSGSKASQSDEPDGIFRVS